MPTETVIEVKSALTRSRIGGVEYVINPYRGCAHGCAYCYAPLMMARAGDTTTEAWGEFVRVKANLPAVLAGELRRRRKPPGAVLLSSVCDPYQPAERHHRITRQCLEILVQYGWRVEILTRSPSILDDLELLKRAGAYVGFSIPTDNDRIRRIVEPMAPSIEARVAALAKLHEAGIETWAFIAPILPLNAERLVAIIGPHIGGYMTSALNYHDLVRDKFREGGLSVVFGKTFAKTIKERLKGAFGE